MRRRISTIVLAGGVLFVLCSSGMAERKLEFGEQQEREGVGWQASVGVGLRLDGTNRADHVPSINGQVLYYVTPSLAFRSGLEVNPSMKIRPLTEYHSVIVDLGMRFTASDSPVGPFFETGVCYPIYWGVERGIEYTEYQPGLRFGGGLGLRPWKSVILDLSVQFIVNDLSSVSYPITDGFTTPPCELGMDCSPIRGDVEKIYNGISLELAARFGL